MKTIIDHKLLDLISKRLCYQLIETYKDFSSTALIGIQPRGVVFSDYLVQKLNSICPNNHLQYGKLDITFYRDDVHSGNQMLTPNSTDLNFNLEGKKVILIDDVLYTGRTIRAAMDALLDYGRPSEISLMVLINRRFSREMPIQADYIGRSVDTIDSQKVKVILGQPEKDQKVILIDK